MNEVRLGDVNIRWPIHDQLHCRSWNKKFVSPDEQNPEEKNELPTADLKVYFRMTLSYVFGQMLSEFLSSEIANKADFFSFFGTCIFQHLSTIMVWNNSRYVFPIKKYLTRLCFTSFLSLTSKKILRNALNI